MPTFVPQSAIRARAPSDRLRSTVLGSTSRQEGRPSTGAAIAALHHAGIGRRAREGRIIPLQLIGNGFNRGELVVGRGRQQSLTHLVAGNLSASVAVRLHFGAELGNDGGDQTPVREEGAARSAEAHIERDVRRLNRARLM
jgi:hypothetical protein